MGCNAAEAAVALLRAQNKQHAGSIMGPPVTSKGYVFGYFSYCITQPLQAERLRSSAGKGRKDVGRKGRDG